MTDDTRPKFRIGGQPMTIERIRCWQRRFAGAPDSQVPFGPHATKYLMHLLEAVVEHFGGDLEALQAMYGNAEPKDGPWASEVPTSWSDRVAACEGRIPYGRDKAKGTEAHPSFSSYEEYRHEAALPLTSPELETEHRMRAAERQRTQGVGKDLFNEVQRTMDEAQGVGGGAGEDAPADVSGKADLGAEGVGQSRFGKEKRDPVQAKCRATEGGLGADGQSSGGKSATADGVREQHAKDVYQPHLTQARTGKPDAPPVTGADDDTDDEYLIPFF